MINQPTKPAPKPNRAAYVILMVLIVIVVLALAAYQYSDRSLSESKVANIAMRQAQARMAADAGVNYLMAALSTQTQVTTFLNGITTNNPTAFQDVIVNSDNNPRLQTRFSILTPIYDSTQSQNLNGNNGFIFGVIDEGSKINLNAWMLQDPTGVSLYNLLMQMSNSGVLLNMTDPIAASICIWLGATDNPNNPVLGNGATDSYYASLSPPYTGKYGPIDTLDELLFVQGVTPQYLYGSDRNRNGSLDLDEDSSLTTNTGGNPVDCGWSQFFTVYGRELNQDPSGNPRVYLGTTDLTVLNTNLINAGVDPNLTTYIVLYRQYGPAAVTPASTTGNSGGGMSGGTSNSTPGVPAGNPGALSADLISANTSTTPGPTQIKSVYSLINSYVSIPAKPTTPTTTPPSGGTTPPSGRPAPPPPPTYYACPLTTSGSGGDLDSLLTTLVNETTTSQATQINGRININTAPLEVLTALQGVVPTLTSDLIQTILTTRQGFATDAAPISSFTTPGWLITQASPPLPPSVVAALDPYITTQTSVYRFQVLGYFDSGGPKVRLDVVIDSNGGMPLLLYRNDITSELGPGYDLPSPQ